MRIFRTSERSHPTPGAIFPLVNGFQWEIVKWP